MARISVGEFLKKRLGSSSSRDPRVTWSGTFGTESSRKKQANRLAEQPPEVGVTARKRPNPVAVDEVPAKAAPKAASKPAAKPAAKPAPKAAAKPKEDRMKGFMADLESRNPKNAVLEKLRKRAEMGEKGLSSDNQYADRFKKFGFAKGGHVKADGCAKKGKTRGRII
jgi:hypothetical protein